MKEADFVFDRTEGGKYGFYWFRVCGETKEELTEKYMEQSMIEVAEVAFDLQDGWCGVKRIFPLRYDIIPNNDRELQTMVQKLVFKVYRERKEQGDGNKHDLP